MTRVSKSIAIVVCLPFLLVAAIAWLRFAPRVVPDGQPPLVTLDWSSLETFRDTFNAHAGEVRLLVMLSPT